ncbi:hypothetical protein EMIT0357P_120089 [Pseudomonas marginalis]
MLEHIRHGTDPAPTQRLEAFSNAQVF